MPKNHPVPYGPRRAAAWSLLACLSACGAAATTTPSTAGVALTHDQRMAWWREARFGMFLHWGLYAIPAGAHGDKTHHGEWIRDSARIPVDTYEQFQQQWNPSRFDAQAWVEMAAAAGMKYVVITSKHHDGFCLYDSAETDWDVGKTPHGRDILRELSDACRARGIKFCTYHSIMDWHHPDYTPRRPWEAAQRSAAGADFDRFERYLHAQVKEIITRYRPAVMWFDGEWEATWSHERGVRLFDLCRSLAPAMIVNNRVDVHRGGMAGFSTSKEAVGDFDTPEQEIPATGLPGVDWESCMTMNDHWGWNAADSKWKSAAELVRNLIDIASKGGNYLLNVGPRADGTFPPAAVERLRQIGDWMRTNGESIHGTTASVFAALPFGRCTVRATPTVSKLYLHVFDRPPDGKLKLPGVGNTVRRAYLLQAPHIGIPAEVAPNDNVVLTLPPVPADAIATVAVVEIDGTPIIYQPPQLTAESLEFVTGVDVAATSSNPELTVRYTRDGSEPTAASPIASGPIRVTESCTLRAATFRQDRRVADSVSRTFTKVVPLPPVKVIARGVGLRCERYNVDWQSIPAEITELPVATSIAAEVGFATNPGEHVALRFRGFIDIAEDELYRFALSSDDGSTLSIDGQLVIDNNGLHGPIEKRGTSALARGLHSIEVVWWNRTGGAELRLSCAKPGQPLGPLPAAQFRH
jgi:alpha-L-fucosidase